MADVIDFGDEKRRRVAEAAASILGEATPKPPRRRTPKPAPLKAGNTMYVNNSGEISGQIAGGDIHNHTYAEPPKPAKVTIQPPAEALSEAQKVELVNLRNEWVALHNAIKQRKITYGGAQKKINDQAPATSYHLIPANRFDFLMGYIKRQMAILRNMKSAPAKDPKWHASKISAIKTRCKKQLGDEFAYRAYIKKNFGADSLTDLSTDELQRTHTYIFQKKPKKD